MPYDSIVSRTDAAAAIPEDVAAVITREVTEQSAAMSLFTKVPMSRAQTRMPVLSALPVAYFVSGDTGLKQTTDLGWANKFLNAEEIAAILPIPEAVVADMERGFWDSSRPLLAEAIGRTFDAAVFFGVNKPSSWPTDIVAAAVAAGNTVNRTTNNTAAGGLAQDLSDVFATVEADGFDVDGVIAVRSIKGRLRSIRNSQGDTQDGEVSSRSIFGVEGDRLRYPMRGLWPTGSGSAEVIAGDFTEGIVGVRQDITWKVLDQAVIQDNTGAIVYNLAQQDMIAIRVVARYAWQVKNIINFDQATEANRYPFAVLRTP